MPIAEPSPVAVNERLFDSHENRHIQPVECSISTHSDLSASVHCCTSACVFNLPFISSMSPSHFPDTSRAPIGNDGIDKVVTRIQVPFRPPITHSLI
ncbi:hypothetical protein ACFFUP_01235 [Vibrio ostreicida]|nr:hypothetical protein [Vibrio ostreicida]NPD07684.1 hypothetical protein [Vibrio ostreicida]